MPQNVRGVVARAKGEPVTHRDDRRSRSRARARRSSQIQACGVCHTDLHYREGGINDDFPFLLGHEAAASSRRSATGVTDVAPGDFVILNWRAVCGAVPGVPPRPAVVLLRHLQRHARR